MQKLYGPPASAKRRQEEIVDLTNEDTVFNETIGSKRELVTVSVGINHIIYYSTMVFYINYSTTFDQSIVTRSIKVIICIDHTKGISTVVFCSIYKSFT